MTFDVIVVGGGHAGCEAALAAARMGRATLLVTGRSDAIATMPCNPSIGGPAKGHLVREIDALGGEMGRNADHTQLQIRLLNTGKGPAVQALRAQCDKAMYAARMASVLRGQPGLTLVEALVDGLLTDRQSGDHDISAGGAPWITGVVTRGGQAFHARCVVVTTGTFLSGKLICGEEVTPGGRFGEAPSTGLSAELARLGMRLSRLKTGTPPRIDARSVDFRQTVVQPGSPRPLSLSFDGVPGSEAAPPAPNPVYPHVERHGWRTQMACYLMHTNARVHQLIRDNLHRAPMYNGAITASGPRYCPSIEAKIVRFPDKERHQLYLEPEGFETNWLYVQGMNTSLPEDVQEAMLRAIPATSSAEMLRPGYAVEYDYVPAIQTLPWLESKAVQGLFLAGQMNGTSGYEEAAAQGLLAGINAARRSRGEAPVVFSRSEAYIGVMADDLTTTEIDEPYRLHTSRAEYRLLLRQDNADLRLTPLARRLGLVSEARALRTEHKRQRIADVLIDLRRTRLTGTEALNARLQSAGFPRVERPTTALEYLRRPEVGYAFLAALGDDALRFGVPDDVAEGIEVEAKYAGYVHKQVEQVARASRLEHTPIPLTLDFRRMNGLRAEARERLERVRPATVGQASRLPGVTPADVSVLLVRLRAS